MGKKTEPRPAGINASEDTSTEELEVEISQQGPDSYLLRLRSRPGQATPEIVRIRLLLKVALRRFGFTCLSIKQQREPEVEEA